MLKNKGFSAIALVIILVVLIGGIILGADNFFWFSQKPLETLSIVSDKLVIISPRAEDEWYLDKKVHTIQWTTPVFEWEVNSRQEKIKSSDNIKAFLFLADAESPKKYQPVVIGETNYDSGSFVCAVPQGHDRGAYLN